MTSGTCATRPSPVPCLRMGSAFWRPLAGTVTWAAAAIVPLQAIVRGGLSGETIAGWAVAWLLFLPAFLSRYTRPARTSPAVDVGLIGVQSAVGLVAAAASPDRLSAGILLVVVAGQLTRVERPVAAVWLTVQTAALVWLLIETMSGASAATFGLAFGGLQAFALGTAVLADRERTAREELAASAIELTAAHTMLAEDTRSSERLRISRDLHDALGHHLTALSVQLDIATRLGSGPATSHVQEAHALTRLLLSDVRAVVGELRAEDSDLRSALVALAECARPSLRVALDLPVDMAQPSRSQADAVLRFTQEVITNAIRHARATSATISVDTTARGLAIRAADDGVVTSPIRWGHGLTGMRERFQTLGGDVTVATRPGGGIEVHGWLPHEVPAQ